MWCVLWRVIHIMITVISTPTLPYNTPLSAVCTVNWLHWMTIAGSVKISRLRPCITYNYAIYLRSYIVDTTVYITYFTWIVCLNFKTTQSVNLRGAGLGTSLGTALQSSIVITARKYTDYNDPFSSFHFTVQQLCFFD